MILTRDDRGEHIPGLTEKVIKHTLKYRSTNSLDASEDQINDATWEQVYNCSPISDMIDHKPTYDEHRTLYSFVKELDRRLDTKTMNEWARNLSDILTEKPKQAVPFWRR